MNIKILLVLILIAPTFLFSQSLSTNGKKIVDNNGDEVILRGLGLGGWMLMEGYMMQSSDVADTQHEFRERLVELMGEDKTDQFFDAWLDNHVTKADIDSMAAWGYNSVRLPMHYNLFTLPIEDEPITGENTWIDKGFIMVDSLLSWCEQNSMYLILDLHAAPGGQGYNAAICDYDPDKPSLWESQENKDKTVALWAKLAKRYVDEPWIGGYDLINEVNWNLPGNSALRSLYVEITDSIRSVDTSHIIFIEGNWFANDFTGLTPPWDDNMAYSFHKYWNYNDQGSVDWIISLRDQHNVPLWMGEGGENSNVWFTDAISLFEENEIGWSFWPMKRIETIVGPYSIVFTQGYKDILSYWRNQGPEPTVDEAFTSMMELALNTNSLNCEYRKDVHDAQIRQVSTNETKPFANHVIPGIVFLSDYDLGKLNIAYYDKDNANYSLSTGSFQAWNNGWAYRNDGVDIEANNDQVNSNGYNIGFSEKGEWINYTVNVEESGAYKAIARYATQQSGGKFHLAVNGEDITFSEQVTSTGSWTNFENFEIVDILLPQGEVVLTLEFDNNASINLSSIEFERTGDFGTVNMLAINGATREDEKSITVYTNHIINAGTVEGTKDDFSVNVAGKPVAIQNVSADENNSRSIIIELEDYLYYSDIINVTYDGSSIASQEDKTLELFTNLQIRNKLPQRFALPKKIQAEDFYYMEGLGVEETTDVGGGHNIGYTNPGDFADYLIYTSDTNSYEVSLRVAAQNSQGKVGFYLVHNDGSETELLEVVTPKTGGWQTWTTLTVPLENIIPKGIHKLRMRPLQGEINLNWYQFDILENVYEIGANFNTTVYPNPVYGNSLYIRISDQLQTETIIEIYDISGKLLFSSTLRKGMQEMEINSDFLPKGVSVLRISSDNKSDSVKIVKL